jgi:hypothetical protein
MTTQTEPGTTVAISDVLKSLLGGNTTQAANGTPAPPSPVVLSEDHRKALRELPRVYGVVAPTESRLLTDSELLAVTDERAVLDTILSLADTRKKGSLRETVAFHFDRMAEASGLADGADRDDKGHVLVKQELPVPERGVKWQALVSEGSPRVDSAALLEAHSKGEISREDYLALTSVPEVPRVFDEEKARKAIKKNPRLLFALAQATKPGGKTLTIKTAPYKG